MTEGNYPCKCGHSFINHVYSVMDDRNYVCGVEVCDCIKFIPDNLKYLEKKLGS